MSTFYKSYVAGSTSSNALQTLIATVAYTDTVGKALFTIPAGAYIFQWIINVTTAFNDSGTDILDLGVSGTTQKFAAAVDVSSTGLKTALVVAAQVGVIQSTAQAILGQYTGQNANSSAGAAVIVCSFFVP